MAGLLYPWWLFALVAIPLVRWLHQRFSAQSATPVSAIFLWQDTDASKTPGHERRPPDPAWRRRALIAALLVLALAGPYLDRDRATVTVLFDDSLSMQTIENGESRTAIAERQLAEALDARGFSEVTRRALSDGMPETLDNTSTHWLVTDGASEAVLEWSMRQPIARVIHAGVETENVAVTRLAVRRAIDDPRSFDVLVAVSNTGDASAERRFELAQGDTVLQTIALSLPAGQTLYRHHRLRSTEEDLVASLDSADALPEDDRLLLPATEFKPVVTSVDDGCGSALRSAVEAHPGLAIGGQDADLTISCHENAFPEPDESAEIRILAADPKPLQSAPVWLPGAGPAASIDLPPELVSASSWPGTIDQGQQQVMLQSGTAPLIVATPVAGGEAIVDTVIDMRDERFARQPEFAALVASLVDMATGRAVLEGRASVSREYDESVIKPGRIDVAATPEPAAPGTESQLLAPWFAAAAAVLLLIDIALLRSALPIALRSGLMALLIASLLVTDNSTDRPEMPAADQVDSEPAMAVSTALQTVRPGQRIAIVVETSINAPPGSQTILLANGRPIAATSSRDDVGAASSRDGTMFEITAPPSGPLLLGAEIRDRNGKIVAAIDEAKLLNVAAPPVVTVISATRSTYADSLRRGGWPVVELAPRNFVEGVEAPATPSLLVLDDVAAHDLPASAWEAIDTAVRKEAMGLLVLGGPNSFGLGGYRDSMLESLLPVVSEPPDREPPASVVFLIDVSGSMDNSSRLQIARQAATETAKALRPSDRVGLMTFDVGYDQRLPLANREQHAESIDEAWPETASGGTQLLPALEHAIELLEQDPAEHDILVLLTDGFVSDEDLARLEDALRETSVDVIGLVIVGVGSEPDRGKNAAPTSRLEAAPTSGQDAAPTSGQDAAPTEHVGAASSRELIGILQNTGHRAVPIDDLLRLPELMRSELEESRPALIEGPVKVLASAPAAWLPDSDWPSIQRHLLTRPKDDALIHLVSDRGDVIVAGTNAGAGKVVAITSGFSSWNLDWLVSDFWPELAARLASQVGSRDSSEFSITTARQADGRQLITLDATDRHSTGLVSARILNSASEDVPVDLQPTAPGVVRGAFAPAEAGQHMVVAETATGRVRHRFLVDEPSARGSASDARQGQSEPSDALWPRLLTALVLIGWLLALWWERR